MPKGTGNGATLAFGGSALVAAVTSLKLPELQRGSLDDDDLSTTDIMELVPEDLAKVSELEVTARFDDTEGLPDIHGAAQTALVTLPINGNTTAANLTGTAFLTSVQLPTLQNNLRMEATYKIQYDGKTGPTYTPAVA